MDISVSDAPVGRLLDGRYRVEAMLARGGMATVYRALDTRLDRTVALKVMHAELAADDGFVSRFIGEARSAARLSDPHVVAVFDQGEDSGMVYLAMEYVPGRTLRDVLRERSRLGPGLALEVLEAVLAAIAAAHQAGIVHRDVKPENVLVSDDGRVKVADFGLARALSSGTKTTGLLLGTVNYISPEQALGEPATTRSDVYSAGIVLYELLTGTAPHVGPTDFVVVRSHIDEDVPPPSEQVPVPPIVDDLVRTATQRDPAERFADATSFLAAVRHARTLVGEDDLEADEPSAAEPWESAGVTLGEALGGLPDRRDSADSRGVTDGRRSAEGLGVPAHGHPHTAPPPPPPSTQTRVIDGAPSAASSRRHADRRDRAEARSGSHAQRRRNLRGPIFFAVILLMAVGIAVAAWWYGAGRWASTPSLLNLSADAAVARALDEGLTATADGEAFSETVEAGLVLSSEPRPGEEILRDGEITFVVSKGPERYEVPAVEGMPLDQANAELTKVNLSADVTEAHHDSVPAGSVVSQEIAAGEAVRKGTAVPVVVSTGPEPIAIEDFTGRPAGDAEAALDAAGFVVSKQDQPSNDVAAGVIVSQDPRSGTGVRGQTITLVVSTGPEQIQVPDVRQRPVNEARTAIEQAGLVPNFVGFRPNWEDDPNARVVQQEPGGGTLPRGGTVTLYVF